MEKLYTVEEAAEMLSVTRQAVYKWMKSGQLRYVTIQGQQRGRRIPESAIRALLGTGGGIEGGATLENKSPAADPIPAFQSV